MKNKPVIPPRVVRRLLSLKVIFSSPSSSRTMLSKSLSSHFRSYPSLAKSKSKVGFPPADFRQQIPSIELLLSMVSYPLRSPFTQHSYRVKGRIGFRTISSSSSISVYIFLYTSLTNLKNKKVG